MWLFKTSKIKKLKSSGNVAGLIDALNDESRKNRINAAYTLSNIGGETAIQPLLLTLRDQFWSVRYAAAFALKELGWKPDNGENEVWYWMGRNKWKKVKEMGSLAVYPLIEFIGYRESSKMSDRKDRQDAIKTLGEIADPRAVESLIDLLGDDHCGSIAKDSLVKIGAPASEKLIPFAIKLESRNPSDEKKISALVNAEFALFDLGHDPFRLYEEAKMSYKTRTKYKQPAKSVEQALVEENSLSDEIQTTLKADTSRQFTVLVKRSVNNVWAWFTDFHNWGKWWAPIKSVEGGWTKGGRITWENGDSSKLKTVIPPCEFCIDGAFIDLRWCFEPLSDERTRVIWELSAPKFGASFSDGGSAAFKSEKKSFEKLMSLLNHSDSDLTSDLEATKKPGNNKQHMVDSRGFYDSAPLFLEEEPELEQLFAAPPIIQKPTEYNRDFWASASVEERRMTLVTGYLQHPDPEVRRKSLGLMKKYFTECLAGHAQILVDRLAADPDEAVRREVARIIWEYEREVNCEYAVNKLKDEVAFVSEQSLVGPVRARRALDLLAETAPSEETRSALEHQIADLQ